MDKKWNLQDIKPASDRPAKKTAVKMQTAPKEPAERPIRRRTSSKSNNSSKTFIFVSVGIAIIILGFLVNVLLGGAEVIVKPRNREVTINTDITAYREPKVGELGYEILTLQAEGERQVTSTGQEESTEQATGQITVYKTTPGSERLIKNTRFESPEGLIFRIAESVEVPGGSEEAPGSIVATVFADEVGEEYNLSPTTFTIPGFKEGGYDSLYNSMYAENTSAFTGGFEGVRFILDDADLASAQEDVRKELRDALAARLDEEKPAGTIMFKETVTYSYESLPATESSNSTATIREKVYLRIPLFKKDDLASYLAEASVPGYENEPVRVDDYSNLAFEFVSASSSATNIANLTDLNFDLSGKVQLVWTFDEESLKNDLAGKNRTAIVNILAAYPAIENTKIIIRPFWKRSLPDNSENIEIIEDLNLSSGNE